MLKRCSSALMPRLGARWWPGGSPQLADSIGSSVKLMNRLTRTEATTVSPKGRNHSPERPGMKATGTNTATIEKVVAATARPISRVPCSAALTRSAPRSMWRTMFSRTTMASSMSTPMASDRPSRLMKFSVKPASQTAMKEASTEVGSDSAVIRVERQELRNR